MLVYIAMNNRLKSDGEKINIEVEERGIFSKPRNVKDK